MSDSDQRPEPTVLEIVPTATASNAALRAVARHDEALRAERMPEDPPMNEDSVLAALRHQSADFSSRHFLLWEGGEVVGKAAVQLPLRQNIHSAFVDLSVLAARRRQGLARRLLGAVGTYASQLGRRKLLTNASSRLPAGEATLRRLGAELTMEQQFIQLVLSELEPGRLADWMTEARAGAPQYRLWQNQGAYPADRLEAIAGLHGVMNTLPRGSASRGKRDLEPVPTTPEALRAEEERLIASGARRLSTFMEHAPSGHLVAFTELLWHGDRPTLVFQHATAVDPQHRRHRLGRWIKAANLHALPVANPQARFVRAGNTDDNTGMLNINRELGFRPYATHTDWQMDTEALLVYLNTVHLETQCIRIE